MVSNGRVPSGKTRMVRRTGKFTTVCWLATNSINMPLAMKCQINNEKSRASHTQHKAGLHSENWWTSQLRFFGSAQSLCTSGFRGWHRETSSPKVVILAHLPFALEIWSQMVGCRVARLGWQNYHCVLDGIELEKHAAGHEMSHQQSEKQSFPYTTQSCIASENLVGTYHSAASLFCTALSICRTIFRP